MRHKAIRQRGENLFGNFLRLRPENAWAGNDNFFAYADKQVGIHGKIGVHKVKMLHYDPALVIDSLHNCFS